MMKIKQNLLNPLPHLKIKSTHHMFPLHPHLHISNSCVNTMPIYPIIPCIFPKCISIITDRTPINNTSEAVVVTKVRAFRLWSEKICMISFPADFIIDEHFRKSLMTNHQKSSGRCLTPDESSSSCSSCERPSGLYFDKNLQSISIFDLLVGSIEEHFARSLAKFRPPVSDDDRCLTYHQLTESVVDDHFAKALGAKTWDKLKDKY